MEILCKMGVNKLNSEELIFILEVRFYKSTGTIFTAFCCVPLAMAIFRCGKMPWVRGWEIGVMSADFTRLAPVAVNLLRSAEIDGANSRAQIFRMVMDIISPRRFSYVD